MDADRTKVVIYRPPEDGLPYAVVAIVDGTPEDVSFELTEEAATKKARITHELAWRAQHKFGDD